MRKIMDMNYDFLEKYRVIPVVVPNGVDETLAKLGALREGGVNVAEITFRTECAEECVRAASLKFPDMFVGAGTVLNADQCKKAISAGAKFVVSPGLGKDVFEECEKAKVPYLAGVSTATEIMAAKALGLTVLKFFPAEACGGVKTLKALSSAFVGVSFVPTGGVGEENFLEYLSLSCVKAVGGSWMMKGDVKEKASRIVSLLGKTNG